MQSKPIRNNKLLALIPIIVIIVVLASTFSQVALTVKPQPAVPLFLDPKTIPKYVNQLVVPPVYRPDDGTATNYTISMVTARQQILPTGTVLVGSPDNLTAVWGYRGNATAKGATLGVPDGTSLPDFVWSPSATFEAVKGTPINVIWVNEINGPQPFAVDPTLYWANPWKDYDPNKAFPDGDIFASQNNVFMPYPPGYNGTFDPLLNPAGKNAQAPVPLVPHLHGAEVPSEYDGGPDAWWTSAATDLKGPHYNTVGGTAPAGTAVYNYVNAQPPGTLWYHDHALGITRLNVMSGLAGYYLLRDPPTTPIVTPNATNFDQWLTQTFQYGVSEIPLAIQDRTFKANGELWFPEVGLNLDTHPYWAPEFFGDTIMVNGLVWPNLNVTQGVYRFRLLNGSNARFYHITLKDMITGVKLPFVMIGSDGSYLMAPVTLKELTIAPGERADILVDFSLATLGGTVIVENKAKTPFPNGAQPDPKTTGQIMQFTVQTTSITPGVPPATVQLPATGLNPTLPLGVFPTFPPAGTQVNATRFITLNEVMGPLGPVMALINGQHYFAKPTENATEGTTEDWVIINLTGDTHPIHLHLVTFQLVSRQALKAAKYEAAWILQQQINATTLLPFAPPFPEWYAPVSLDPTPYLQGKAAAAPPTEMCWKDTIQMNPGEVTIIRVRITSQDGTAFPFDPTTGPGYVYHCHILDHEDNEMMRPFIINATALP